MKSRTFFIFALFTFFLLIPFVLPSVVEITIEYGPSPILSVEITDYQECVQASQSLTLRARVRNTGTLNATNVWLAFSLPADWTLESGVLNKSIGMLDVNEEGWNEITVTTGSKGTYTLTVSAGCAEEVLRV